MSRIEEIRKRAQRANQLVVDRDSTPALGITTRTYAADVAYLLERVEELEADLERLIGMVEFLQDRR